MASSLLTHETQNLDFLTIYLYFKETYGIIVKLLEGAVCMNGLAVYCLGFSRSYPRTVGMHLLMPPALLPA